MRLLATVLLAFARLTVATAYYGSLKPCKRDSDCWHYEMFAIAQIPERSCSRDRDCRSYEYCASGGICEFP
ncbi:unnamed protein product, partial [Mesorhabditis spiculigera]